MTDSGRSGRQGVGAQSPLAAAQLREGDYARLLALRNDLRRFLRWSEERARAVGLTPAQHQLLLAVRGHENPAGPTIGEIADHLLLRHQSAVGLVDRAEAEGLVERVRSGEDHRVVRVALSARGAELLSALSALHAEELRRLAGRMGALAAGLEAPRRDHGGTVKGPAQGGGRRA